MAFPDTRFQEVMLLKLGERIEIREAFDEKTKLARSRCLVQGGRRDHVSSIVRESMFILTTLRTFLWKSARKSLLLRSGPKARRRLVELGMPISMDPMSASGVPVFAL